MKSYRAYSINHFLAFILFVCFSAVFTFLFMLFIIAIESCLNENSQIMLMLLAWPFLIYAGYLAAMASAASRRDILLMPRSIILEKSGNITINSPVMEITLADVTRLTTVYGSDGCRSISLFLTHGSSIKLYPKPHIGNRREFDELAESISNLLNTDMENKKEGENYIYTTPIAACKAGINFFSYLFLGIPLTLLNIFCMVAVYSAVALKGKPAIEIVLFIMLWVMECYVVCWFFWHLSNRKLAVLIYKDKVVVRQLKNYWFQGYRVNEVYYKNIVRYVTMWTKGNSDQKTIKFTDKNNEVYIVEEDMHLFGKQYHNGYYIEQHLTKALRQFEIDNDIHITMQSFELEPETD